MDKQQSSFVRGTFILTAAAFITRILGFLGSIVLARFLGPEGIGLLMMAHPLVPMMITLTSLGLPVAISKLVAEAEAQRDAAKVKRILQVSLSLTVTISIVLTLGTFIGAKWIASFVLADQRAYYAMLAIIPIAPLVAISSVLKGYFRGKQNMTPIAVSDVIENIVHILLIMGLVQLLLPYGIEYAAAGAMICTVMGECSSLLFLLLMYMLHKRKHGGQIADGSPLPDKKRTLYELLNIGLPSTGQGFINSIYRAFKPTLVIKSLAIAGIGTAVATKQYGLLVGYAFPLLVFPTFIMHSLSTALIPSISEANASNNQRLIHQRIDQAIQLAFIIGAPCTILLYMWAIPLTTTLYHAPEAGNLLKLLAPFFLLHYFEDPLHAILLGIGRVKTVMWNFIMSTLLQAIAMFILGSKWGIYGVATGINFGVCIITMLNFLSVSTYVGFSLDVRHYLKTILCLITMAFCGQGAYAFLSQSGFSLPWAVTGAITVSILTYLLSLMATNTVRLSERRGSAKGFFTK
ncbi:stage V sporulation protein B [Paenibacillus doosanensis]|uniref:stage V sporulation protein B n=1 Tax=Paenibacillus doosanensis TaxID=1229154 RepID=UPI002180070E|nr:stage V sporulation protein B [Paenibacillus doosanensis]MCS7464392.1 stage V sporulation protein B [Paenibacillus doosanensis]